MKPFLYPADMVLPRNGFEKWAVIACDQYTSDSHYWNTVKCTVGDAPSTLHMILPELYLSQAAQRIPQINATMASYLQTGVLQELPQSMVYVERRLSGGGVRHGIVGMIDLTDYEYAAGSHSLIRATEKTVTERIPPRVQIRRDAPLEFPHVLLFINDPENTVIGSVEQQKERLTPLYDFELMQHGGHLSGYRLDAPIQETINQQLASLVNNRLLFAVGDGNHSLATAKECYRESGNEAARYALVEVVNIHDPVIQFEPIYRVLFGTTRNELIAYLAARSQEASGTASHRFTLVDCNGEQPLSLTATAQLPVGTLQPYLDEFLCSHCDVSIDYIHGIDETRRLCAAPNTVGFLFDGMKKSELFEAVIHDGALPRKTFSMGTADDKRFYLEGRRIR